MQVVMQTLFNLLKLGRTISQTDAYGNRTEPLRMDISTSLAGIHRSNR